MTNSIDNPFNYFTDAAGGALDAGKIYIGIAGLDPVANPITMYWDAELTITAAQPIRTSGGYPVYLGSAATLYADKSDYSIKVESAVGVLIYSSLNISKRVPAALVTYAQGGAGAVARTVEAKLNERVSCADFGKTEETVDQLQYCDGATEGSYIGGGGTFYWDATSTATDNGGTVVKATAVATGRWLRVYSGAIDIKWFGADATGVVSCTARAVTAQIAARASSN